MASKGVKLTREEDFGSAGGVVDVRRLPVHTEVQLGTAAGAAAAVFDVRVGCEHLGWTLLYS